MIKRFCLKYLPLYIKLPFTVHWLAIWSAPRYPQTHWQALRITLRYGVYHSKVMQVLKKGII